MKSLIEACLLGSILISGSGAPVASHAVEMRVSHATLGRLTERTVYVKADSRAPYQTVLSVLDALRGKSVVLLSAPPANAVRPGYAPPYGTKLIVSR